MQPEDPFERWSQDPHLARVDQQMRAELRADAEEDERLAVQALLRGRGLADVARELAARGDTVSVAIADRSFTGAVTHSAGDLACITSAVGELDVRLTAPVVVTVLKRSSEGGRGKGHGPATFRARLSEHEAAGGAVELGALWAPPLVGRIAAVAEDHVVLDSAGLRSYVSLASVAYALQRR
ncbi:MAG TPA: hypothetical protein VML96_03075 [Egibacteraceae bacterium]|nr:hypothetical protein [Egibacteraceae bacterium]